MNIYIALASISAGIAILALLLLYHAFAAERRVVSLEVRVHELSDGLMLLRNKPPNQGTSAFVNPVVRPQPLNDPALRRAETLLKDGSMVLPMRVWRDAVACAEGIYKTPCPICHGDCASANPPVAECPIKAAQRVIKFNVTRA